MALLRLARPVTKLLRKTAPSLASIQYRCGGGGPSPGEDYGANKDDNPYLWDPHYVPCEESDYERHHFFLEKHEKDRYAIPQNEWNHKLDRADVLARITKLVQAMPRANTDNR